MFSHVNLDTKRLAVAGPRNWMDQHHEICRTDVATSCWFWGVGPWLNYGLTSNAESINTKAMLTLDGQLHMARFAQRTLNLGEVKREWFSQGDTLEWISHVKNAPASQIEPDLPSTTFEKWLSLQVGNDATISWVVRIPDDPVNGPPLVEADVSIQGRPGIVIMIAALKDIRGTKFRFESLLLMWPDYAEWPNLGDLPKAVERAKAACEYRSGR
jgi:hypothetical protein